MEISLLRRYEPSLGILRRYLRINEVKRGGLVHMSCVLIRRERDIRGYFLHKPTEERPCDWLYCLVKQRDLAPKNWLWPPISYVYCDSLVDLQITSEPVYTWLEELQEHWCAADPDHRYLVITKNRFTNGNFPVSVFWSSCLLLCAQ